MTGADIAIARSSDPVELRRAMRTGELERVRRGAYRPPDGRGDSVSSQARRLAVDRVTAVHHQLRAPHWFSHETAALLWGCPLWTVPGRTHLLQAYRPSSRASRDLHRRQGEPGLQEQTVLGGLPVTTLERTVADCATTLHPLDALVIADAALRLEVDLAEVRRLVGKRCKGRARGLVVLDLADDGAESAWESWLRYVALWAGLPRPETQVPVVTRLRTYRVDLGWTEHRVIAEFDGQVKYRDGELSPDHDGARVRFAEKRRDEAIQEATGILPLHVTSKDAIDVDQVARRLVARFPEEVRRDLRPRRLLWRPR